VNDLESLKTRIEMSREERGRYLRLISSPQDAEAQAAILNKAREALVEVVRLESLLHLTHDYQSSKPTAQ